MAAKLQNNDKIEELIHANHNTETRAVQHLPSPKNPTGLTISDSITARSEWWFGRLQVASVKTRYDPFKSQFNCLRNRRTRPAQCLSLFQSQISCSGEKPLSLNSKLR